MPEFRDIDKLLTDLTLATELLQTWSDNISKDGENYREKCITTCRQKVSRSGGTFIDCVGNAIFLNIRMSDIVEWLDNNVDSKCWQRHGPCIWFKNESDATAFLLVWS